MVIFPDPKDHRGRVEISHDLAFRNFLEEMRDTEYSRKMDSSGRVVVPSSLRDQLDLRSGDECHFFIHEDNGRTFLCFECPRVEDEIEKAKRILREAGINI